MFLKSLFATAIIFFASDRSSTPLELQGPTYSGADARELDRRDSLPVQNLAGEVLRTRTDIPVPNETDGLQCKLTVFGSSSNLAVSCIIRCTDSDEPYVIPSGTELHVKEVVTQRSKTDHDTMYYCVVFREENNGKPRMLDVLCRTSIDDPKAASSPFLPQSEFFMSTNNLFTPQPHK